MNKFAFCTLAIGEKYRTYSKVLIKQISDLNHKIYVMTDKIDDYENTPNIIIIPYTKQYFSFHEKRTVVRECLKSYDAAIFLDADVVLTNIDENNIKIFNDLENGLHVYATFGNIWSSFFEKHGNSAFELVETLKFKYKKQFHKNIDVEDYIEHFLEGKWILKKDNGKEEDFLKLWDQLTEFCETFDINRKKSNRIGSEEGAIMSLACYNSGIKYTIVGGMTTFINKHFISNYQEKINGTKPWNIAG